MSRLRTALSNGAVVVNFTKADGTERVMRATTAPSLIKGRNAQPIDPSYESRGNITVWDLDLKDFRTIKESRVHDWEKASN